MGYIFKNVNHLVGKAIHSYKLLDDGDRIIVAISGGVDSLLTLWFLNHWLEKAPISYEILAVHLDMGFKVKLWPKLKEFLLNYKIPFYYEETNFGNIAHSNFNKAKSPCFLCAMLRRKRLFEIAYRFGFNKIALGHHQDDIIETFFMNMCFSGELSTMVPRQEMFKGLITIIRPLSFVDKEKIDRVSKYLKLPQQKNPCPSSKDNRREFIRQLLFSLYKSDSKIKGNIMHALKNVRLEYLL